MLQSSNTGDSFQKRETDISVPKKWSYQHPDISLYFCSKTRDTKKKVHDVNITANKYTSQLS